MGTPSASCPRNEMSTREGREGFNETKIQGSKVQTICPHRGSCPEPHMYPSPPFRPPAEAQGLQFLPQIALELGQASLGLQFLERQLQRGQ